MPRVTAKTRLLALLGHPVGHSLSPAMHQAALDAANIDAVYVACDVVPTRLSSAVRGLAAMGAIGANVTVPHKEECAGLADELSPLAKRIGAVNTLVFRDGRIMAANTDAPAFIETLRRDGGVDPDGQVYAQVGTGGAGRAMAYGAAEAGAARILLANRDRSKAEALATSLRHDYPKTLIEVVDLSAARKAFREAKIIANATSLGLNPSDPPPLPAEAFSPGSLAFDAVYPRREHGGPNAHTPFLFEARRSGAKLLGGLGMLVRQGASAFEIWTGKRADPALMRRVAERELGGEDSSGLPLPKNFGRKG